MQNRRLFFSAVIKLLMLLGFLILAVVLINSLFTKNERVKVANNTEIPIAIINTSDMFKGQIRKIRWNNKEVAVLLRQFPEKLSAIETKSENLHPSLDLKTRSKNKDYFVYLNIGDSNNCPLFYSAGEFKDVCSANKFDEAGLPLQSVSNNFKINIPPHYFDDEDLIIGKWEP